MDESVHEIEKECDKQLVESTSSSSSSTTSSSSSSSELECESVLSVHETDNTVPVLDECEQTTLMCTSNLESTDGLLSGIQEIKLDELTLLESSNLDLDERETRPIDTKCPSRNVSFPLNDEELVTGYLEPANPWEQAQNVTITDIILAYRQACDRYESAPLSTVIDQLEKLDITKGRCVELNLKGQNLDRNHTEPLEEVLKCLQFDKINLESSSLDDESAECLFDMIEYYETAKYIDISSNCNIGERGWQACAQMLKKTECLEQLDAKDIVMTQQHMNILKRSLQLATHLQVLKLENCGLAGRAFIILTTALKDNTGLKELYLADNALEKSDAVLLSALVRSNYWLQLLDVSNNYLRDPGVRDLLDGLIVQAKHPKEGRGLSVLILWNNQFTRDSSGHFVELLEVSKSLETLNIGQNLMGDDFLEVCRESLIRNNVLLQLGVQATGLMQKGILALAEVVEKNAILQRIDLRDNNLQLTGLTYLLLALKKNTTITRIDLDDKTWSKSPPLIEQYAELVAEIRSYYLRNEEAQSVDESTEELSSPENRSRLSSVSSRKISLTCQTLPRSPPLLTTSASEVTGRTMMMPGNVPKRTSGGRLRSPAPSPIPSPVASPIPSPSRGRFVVSRVSESTLSSTNSSASSSPVTPPSSASSPSFFPEGSRFRVTLVSSNETTLPPTSSPLPPPTPPPPPFNLPEFKVDVPDVLDSGDSDGIIRLVPHEPEDMRLDSESGIDSNIRFDDHIKQINTNDHHDADNDAGDDEKSLSISIASTLKFLSAKTPAPTSTVLTTPTTTTTTTTTADKPDALKNTSSLERLLGLFHNPGGIFTSFETSVTKNPFHEGVNSMMALGDRFQRYLRESRTLDVINTDSKCKNNDNIVDDVNMKIDSSNENDANSSSYESVNKSYVPAALDESLIDKKNECLMLPRTFNNVQTIIYDSNITQGSINNSNNLNNDTHHCNNTTCDVNNLLDDDNDDAVDKDINIPIIYENITEATRCAVDHNDDDDVNNQGNNTRSQMNLIIHDRSINHRNSQDSGIEESTLLPVVDDNIYHQHNRPREHFQGSIDSGIESECSPVCTKLMNDNNADDVDDDDGCLKELRRALNIPTLDDNKQTSTATSANVDQLICQSVEGS